MAIPGVVRVGGSSQARVRYVRHAFWKYPIIAAILAVALIVLAILAGSPNWPQATIAVTYTKDPGGAILAMTTELDGTSPSWSNTAEPGMPGTPAETFVVGPVRSYHHLLGPSVVQAVADYDRATRAQQKAWAANYHQALDSITPMASQSAMGAMAAIQSPDYTKVDTLTGDFGPVPTIVKADLELGQGGYLEQYLGGISPGHALHLVNICLYDHPAMLNEATTNGLTDDQWGMVKERGFAVGPWFLIIPALIHVKLPGGSSGTGFALWNLLFALVLILALPLIPGLRDLPQRLKLYRLIYRYPLPHEESQNNEDGPSGRTRA